MKYFNFITHSDVTRTAKAKKNIVLLLLFNGFNFLFVLISVPLTIRYLGTEDYGIWITISSFLLWLNFFDFGIGNGLRNKLAESLAYKKREEAKTYVSTAYFLFTIILVSLWILFIPVNFFVNWSGVLNITSARNYEMKFLMLILVAFFNIQFILKLITSILHADQNTAMNGFLSFLVNLFTLIVTYLLLIFSKSSLAFLAYSAAIIPVLVFLGASYYLFSGKYSDFSPSIRNINFSYVKGLFGLGIKFFTIQVAGLIVFSTQNLLITQLFGPAEVTTYNIAYRYFFFVVMFFNIILTPLWSAYTEAYVKKDFFWIKRTIRKTIIVWIILSVITILMLLSSGTIYEIWIGKDIFVPFQLSLFMAAFIILSNWNNIFAYFLNGTGKITLQFYFAIFTALISIPLSYLFAQYFNFGIAGIIAGSTVCLLFGAIWAPVQYKKIISGNATGVWGK